MKHELVSKLLDGGMLRRAIMLPGVRMGARVVIGAGSVVTRHVPGDILAAGTWRVVRVL